MIDPATFHAAPIDGLPIALHYVRTLEECDGPLLAEFQSDSGDPYLYHWCDREGHVSRWIVVKTTRQDLNRYLVGVTTLHDLIVKCRDGFVYLLDLDPEDNVHAAYYVAVTKLPDLYVPGEATKYDPTSASAVDTLEETDGAHQDVYVGDAWGPDQVAMYPRWYIQAHTFEALYGRNGHAGTPPTIHYRLTTGYVFSTHYNALQALIPRNHSASLVGLTFNSPGYVRFKVHAATAARVRDAVARYKSDTPLANAHAQALRRWANEHAGAITDVQARRVFDALSEIVGVDAEKLRRGSESLKIAAKALLSFLNRVVYLAAQDDGGEAMLVGLKRPRSTDNPPTADAATADGE